MYRAEKHAPSSEPYMVRPLLVESNQNYVFFGYSSHLVGRDSLLIP